jgi:hypothetical protein
MKYDLVMVEEGEDLFWCIYEKATEQVIKFFVFKEDAVKKLEFLENGGSFSGFTPSFVLKEIPIQRTNDEINKNFENLLD